MRPPGPKGLPFVGNTLQYFHDPLGKLEGWVREYGDIVYLSFLGTPTYILTSPDDIEHVLLKAGNKYVKGFRKQRLSSPFGQGLLVSEGELWRRQRRLMQPAFNREHMATYADRLPEAAAPYLESWRDGDAIALESELKRLMQALFVKLLVGEEVGLDFPAIHEMLGELQAYFTRLLSNPVPVPEWVPTPENRRFKRALNGLKDLISKLVADRQPRGTDRPDLLSMLMRATGDGGPMTVAQLQDEVLSLFLAGHETTALTLVYAFYLLAQHPEVESRLVSEVTAVLQGRLPKVEDLHGLPTARHVVQETLRLYPPVYAMVREAVEEDELRGYRLPVGALMVLPQWVVHRDPRVFERADEFVPDRWADGLERRLARFAYFPFGGGARLCIGNHLSLVEATLLLVTIVQRFQLARVSSQPLKLRATLTLSPKESLVLRVQRRSRVEPATSSSGPAGSSGSG